MAGKNIVFGIYANRADVESAAALARSGFSMAEISVLLPEDQGIHEIAAEKSTKGPEGVTAGASAGAVVGGTLGLLAGLGALTIPGVGPLLAAGPIISTLAGIGFGGAVGGFAGALIGLGIPEYEAKRYEGRLQSGGTLLSVRCADSDQIVCARQVMKDTGAEDISESRDAAAAQSPERASGTSAGARN